MVYIEKQSQIVLIDLIEKSFKITDTEGNFIETIYLKNYFKRPKGFCYNSVTDELFVADTDASKILVFSSFNFHLIRTYETAHKPRGIAIDIERSRLFVGSSRDYQDVLVLDCLTGEIIQRIPSKHSVNQINQSADYLIMAIFNGFVLLNKSTCEVIKTINIDFNCEFFEILENQFILTIKEEQLKNYLTLLDFNGQTVQKTLLTIDFEINDFVTFGNRMILNSGYYNPNIHVLNFD
jgi:hypothetical protein